jgi:elongation factor Ts
MMDCKRALEEVGGDEERAIDLLRQWGSAKAAKRSAREMTEGLVVIESGDDAVAMVAVTSETDFVARNEDFQDFVGRLAKAALIGGLTHAEVVTGEEFLSRDENAALHAEFSDLKATIGENLEVQRVVRYDSAGANVGSYLHFGSKIGVLVELDGGESDEVAGLARELAMHIAAARPMGVTPEDLPEDERERERAVLTEQTKLEGKPDHIVDKIVEGRMRKYYEQHALVMQPFVKDPNMKVSDLLETRDSDLEVRRFARFEIGASG